jgi:hypothetical protein
MEQDPGQECVAEAVSESHQMARISAGRRRTGLDLDADDLPAAQLAEDVDLEPALLLPDVVQARS